MNKEYMLKELKARLKELKEKRVRVMTNDMYTNKTVNTLVSEIDRQISIILLIIHFVNALPDNFNLSNVDHIKAFDRLTTRRQYNMSDKARLARRKHVKS